MKPKYLLLALISFCLINKAHTQHTTYSAGVNSGWFSISSKDASGSSSITAQPLFRSQMMGPSKSTPAFSYEINGHVQRVTRSRFLYGAELAYQSLKSSVTVGYITPFMFSSALLQADGKIKLKSQFITLTPYAGYRIVNRKIKIDISSGVELAACIERTEKINARILSTGDPYTGTNKLRNKMDYRVRFQVVASYKRVGLTAGYAKGLENYYHKDDWVAGYSKFIRLGLTYRIN